MRKIGLTLVLALCCLATANATTFTLAGDNGLAGTVVIDTTTGVVTSLNVTYAGDTFTNAMGSNGPFFLGPGVVHIQGWNAARTKLLHLLLGASSLVGYAGGNLFGASDIYCISCSGVYPGGYPCCGGTSTYLSHVTLQ
jgi:hypothetical protein